jgi:hypothetical protein
MTSADTHALREHLATAHRRPGFTVTGYARAMGRTETEQDALAVRVHAHDHEHGDPLMTAHEHTDERPV